MEMKIITVMGSQVGKEEIATLHTATCECGNRMVRAKKETSLKYYIGNEKYKAKCCNSTLTYTGEKQFLGDTLVETKSDITTKSAEELNLQVTEIKIQEFNIEDIKGTPTIKNEEILEETNVEKTIEEEKKNNVTDINEGKPKTKKELDIEAAAGLVEVGKKGITNFQMIPAIKANIQNEDILRKLYAIKPEVFKSSAVYTPDNMKVICLNIIKEAEPKYKMPMGKKMAAELESKITPITNVAI
jgi:hypothetical protein